MEKFEDKRYIKTRDAILNAFKEMVCEKKPELITVKALTERAGIHRKTFYLHYTCIEALYEDALNTLAQEYAAEVAKLPNPYTYQDLTRVLFDFYTRSEYAECLYCNPRFADFSARLTSVTLKNNRAVYNPYRNFSPEMQNIINAFVSNASAIAFRQWVADGKTVPMDAAVKTVGTLLEKGVEAIKA